MASPAFTFSVAPMMDWTDRHCRAFHRVLTARALLYTEMVTADAVRFGDRARLLGWSPQDEGAVALQLGGSDPKALAEAAAIGADFGYHAINLNVGCPSDRVQAGRFGACLMREPELVAECLAAMKAAVPASIPVTVKHRLGVDEQDPEETLSGFVETVAAAGITTFIVHARKAWLKGLSPKENRDIPPLDHAIVHRLKAARPDLSIHLNGGLESVEAALDAVRGGPGPVLGPGLDGMMLGRAAYHNPALLGCIDHMVYASDAGEVTPHGAMERFRPYVAARLGQGVPLTAITRHMLGLFHGRPGARTFRRILGEQSRAPGAGLEVYDAALAAVSRSPDRDGAAHDDTRRDAA
jgi:tRNA-dihydrouridine synthase A